MPTFMLLLPPLSLYIHFPWCIRKCPYCDFNSHTLRTDLPEVAYMKLLIRDLENDLAKVQGRPIISIFMGGGTPSLFSAESISYLLTEIAQRLEFAKSIEITLEANPGTVEYQRFKGYYQAGINRLSLGIQSFQTEKLQALGRIHDGEQARLAVIAAKTAGFSNINLDIMHGLPGQRVEEGLEDLATAFSLNPTHISWYHLTIEPNTEFAVRVPQLPLEDQIFALQELGKQGLVEKDFKQYEISAYAKESYHCRHNRHYWQFGDYLGIGAGAHSKITYLNEQKILRAWKLKNPKTYLKSKDNCVAEEKIILKEDLAFEFMLNALRLYQPISVELFQQRTGLSLLTIKRTLQKAQQQGLLTYDESTIETTDLGKRFYNNLLLLFMGN